MKIKTAVVSILTALSVSAPVYADILGTVIGSSEADFGGGTYLYNVTYKSDQASVGVQNEYYVEYTPNDEVVPVVENGYTVWGKRNITNAAKYVSQSGYRPLIGINGDFFSLQTGIPMGVSVSDGEILTKIDGYIDAIGFREDGSAFVDGLDIKTTLIHNGQSANVECINRYYTKDYTPICLLTDKFSDTTHTQGDCLFLLCTVSEGICSIGEELVLKIEDKFTYNGDVKMTDGKMMIVVSQNSGLYSFVNGIEVGDKVKITNEADKKWENAVNIIGSAAGRLLTNGNIGSGFEKGAAPRSAVGVKADGTVVFYVIDGRQSGHSYGVQMTTLAKRMKELGCVDALNLDGGGSSTIGGVYPGQSTFSVINSPSDGSLRACANYIFLRDSRKATGIPYYVHFVDGENKNYLNGATLEIKYDLVYDTNGYAMDGFDTLEYSVNNNGATSSVNGNTVEFNGTGETTVIMTANGIDLTGFTYGVFDEPNNLRFYDENNNKEIGEVYLTQGEEYKMNFKAVAYANGVELISTDDCFGWSVVGNIGTIDENGNFTADTTEATAGKIVVEKGDFKKELNVFIAEYNDETEVHFADVDGHWAQGRIEYMAELGIINGIELDGKMYFRPDYNMTRAEFAQIVAKANGYTLEFYSDEEVPYTDMSEIPPWAYNAIKAMYSEGIMSGRSDDNGKTYRFDANANITRAEAMTVLGRMLDNEAKVLDFADKAEIPQWAYESIGKLYAIGAIQGYSDNTILPNNNVKRAEAVTMMEKLMK